MPAAIGDGIIDPSYPEDRIKFMLEDVNADILLSNKSNKNILSKSSIKNLALNIIDLEDEILYQTSNTQNNLSINNPNSLAYIIYTSGSTGKPKGVMIEHKNVVNILLSMQRKFPLSNKGTFLLKTTYCFDVSVSELFGFFFEGGRLVILEPGKEKDAFGILDAIEQFNVTHINFVPSMFNLFIKGIEYNSEFEKIEKLNYIFVAGEVIPKEIVNYFHGKIKNVMLVNLYGPTEATVYATYYPLKNGSNNVYTVPIGKPLDNVKTYILDKKLKILPPGIPGEIYISGDGVGRGYYNRPELNKKHFINNPFINGEQMYKTGDLGKFQINGNIEFLGRNR